MQTDNNYQLSAEEIKESPRKLSPLPINDRQPYDKHDEHDYSRSLARDRSTEVG